MSGGRRRILHLAPWVGFGGSDKGTIDWFRWLDRRRYEALLVLTQPSTNRRLTEVLPYAAEVWPLPDLVPGHEMPRLIFDLVHTRAIDVVHVMNARIAFELLPDLVTLEHRPRIVVQLHVEEPDRSGYVRLVCTRFGNLVDGFSVSSQDLAARVEGYGVPRSRIHVIRTGVDAEWEFSPLRVREQPELDPGFHVLYAGRLTEQKDPLLMLDVVAATRERVPELRVHVVGDGPLEADVRAGVAARGLGDVIALHPPTTELAGWYAAADALLMTSRFEGVPYVIYEALAMDLPVVAPALAGNAELLAGGGGRLVAPRDDVAGYAAALEEVADGEASGGDGRRAALDRLSLRRMAEDHAALYERLLADRPQRAPRAPEPEPPHAWGIDRARAWDEPVTVVIPCLDHGRYLGACVQSVRAQAHPAVDVIVVDDGSTDPGTAEVLADLDALDGVQVLRQPVTGGPSRARNRALEIATGRFVLFVDADNLLVDGAIERLTRQLSAADGTVAFVYPVMQYFGNRRDVLRPPDFNLAALLANNFCDTCSLYDAEIFSTEGVRFDEETGLGHEDWALVLQLAGHGFTGVAADGPVLFSRRTGFTRSDLVEYGDHGSQAATRARHPELYGAPEDHGWAGPFAGPAATVKARWAPGLSVVALTATEPGGAEGRRLLEVVQAQTASDLEVLVRSSEPWAMPAAGAAIRWLPAALASTPLEALHEGVAAARAPWLLLTAGAAAGVLARREWAEQLLRVVLARPELQAVVLADAGNDARYPLRVLAADEAKAAHGLLVRAEALRAMLERVGWVDAARPIASLVGGDAGAPVAVQWRHLPGPPVAAPDPTRFVAAGSALGRPRTPAAVAEERWRLHQEPSLPGAPAGLVDRWRQHECWRPVEQLPLVRHRDPAGGFTVTTSRIPPPGFVLDFDLGSVHRHQPPGTAVLRGDAAAGYSAELDADEGVPVLRAGRPDDVLGSVEQAQLPLLVALSSAFHPPSGTWTIVTDLPGDHLAGEVVDARALGFVEGYPNLPLAEPLTDEPFGPVSLVRAVDRKGRRHRYGAGALPPAGVVDLELGSLLREPTRGAALVLAEDGTLAGRRTASARDLARWAVAPVAWRDTGPLVPRLRAAARRGREGLRREARGEAAPLTAAVPPGAPGADGAPPAGRIAGWLLPDPGPERRAVHAATHPATGDVLLTPWPLEAADLGYGPAQLLGYAVLRRGVPGSHDRRPVDVPWASRFGRGARRG